MPTRGNADKRRKDGANVDEEFLIGDRVPAVPRHARRQSDMVRRNRCWLILLGVSVLILGIIALVALGLAGKDYYIDDQIDRYCLNALIGADVRPSGSGDIDAFGFGWIRIDYHAYTLDHELTISALDGNVTTVAIYGPMNATSAARGPLTYDLSDVIVSTSTDLNGAAFENSGRLTPISKTVATAMRDAPSAYYVQIGSDAYPNGGVRAPLGVLC